MPPSRRHRAGRDAGARLRRWARASGAAVTAFPQAPWPSLAALAGGMACAAVIGGVVSKTTAVTLAAIVATAGAGAAAALLIRLALRIHGRAHTFGPCRGAGYLGLGTAIAAATAAAGGLLAATAGDRVATVAVQMGTGLAATSFTAGLLLLPGAAPTIGERLRQGLDGAAIGCAVFLVAWLLVLTPHSGPTGGHPRAGRADRERRDRRSRSSPGCGRRSTGRRRSPAPPACRWRSPGWRCRPSGATSPPGCWPPGSRWSSVRL